MRKPWQTVEWRKKRKELIKGKTCEYCGSTDYLAIHHIQARRQRPTYNDYLSFQCVTILCRRCHFALHKGMTLCPVCKKNYKRAQYETCFNCKPSKEK